MVDALERKIPEMTGLHPNLKSLSNNLDDLTDFSDMDAARVGGQTIASIYKARDEITDEDE